LAATVSHNLRTGRLRDPGDIDDARLTERGAPTRSTAFNPAVRNINKFVEFVAKNELPLGR
jgi:hypothetical protein